MKNIPEWFIGGPLHGKDRATQFPGREQYAYTYSVSDRDVWRYFRQRFTIGARIVIMWVDLNRTSREMAATLLADVLLAPHESPEPETCICTDSVHSAIGKCPTKDGGEYDMCPRRRLSEPEIIQRTAKIRAQERRTMPDNTGDSDRWEDSRDTFGGETDNETGKKRESA